jgi:hypothetical protein
MKKVLLAAVALIPVLATWPAHASAFPMVDQLSKVDEAVKDIPPWFGCYDMTDKTTCQTVRATVIGNAAFQSMDLADGAHMRCYLTAEGYGVSATTRKAGSMASSGRTASSRSSCTIRAASRSSR